MVCRKEARRRKRKERESEGKKKNQAIGNILRAGYVMVKEGGDKMERGAIEKRFLLLMQPSATLGVARR